MNERGNDQDLKAEGPGTDIVSRSEVGDISVLSELTKAEVDVQVATAKAYPRSVQQFQEECYELATLDQETAQSMFYGFKRGGKYIEGPSVRFAEIVAYSWGNLRVEGRVINEGRKRLTAQGIAWDMERNLGARIEVQRKITTREGKRFSEDMITVTGNAAVSIAIRNAIFDVVPAALARKAYKAALATAAKSGKPMEKRREEWVAEFTDRGVDEEDIYRTLGVKGKADIGVREIRQLIGMKNAVEEGDLTLEEAFAGPRPASEGAKDLNEKLKQNGQEKEEPDLDAMDLAELHELALELADQLADAGDQPQAKLREEIDLAEHDENEDALRQIIEEIQAQLGEEG